MKDLFALANSLGVKHVLGLGCKKGDFQDAQGHPLEALQEWWEEARCSATGTCYPEADNIAWWNTRSVAGVKADMALYNERADADVAGYRMKAYGA